jgi:hypothetical protein
MCEVHYLLNGQGTRIIETMKMKQILKGTKGAMIWRSYKSVQGKEGHTHYPVPGNFAVGKKNIENQWDFIFARIGAVKVAIDEIQGCDSKIKLPVDTGASGHVR